MPQAIQAFYERNGDWDKITKVRDFGGSTYTQIYKVYFEDAYDKWCRNGDEWSWSVGYY